MVLDRLADLDDDVVSGVLGGWIGKVSASKFSDAYALPA